MAYYRVEPFGPDVDHFMMATLIAAVVNARRARSKPFTADDFMPKWTKPTDPADEADQFRRRADGAMSTLAAMAAKSGGKQRAQQRPKKGKEAT